MIMSTQTGEATQEEVAEIIFNSNNSELNDMLLKAKSNNHEVKHLIWKITVEINANYLHQLIENSDSFDSRKAYLFNKIKYMLVYDATWY